MYDLVVEGSYPEDMPEDVKVDCIVFNDVLEHTVDPWSVLRETKRHLNVGGCVVASIPNVRYLPVLIDLIFRSRWEYVDEGVLDRTHLRFFTRSTIEEMFASSGLKIARLEPINPFRRRGGALLKGVLGDTRYLQFAVLARPV